MPFMRYLPLLPSKLRYKLLISFCLMSVVPILVGMYVASLFIKYPYTINPENIQSISLIMICTLVLSFLGYKVTQQLINPIIEVTLAAENIAKGNLDSDHDIKGSDELEELSRSLKTISKNARELIEKVDRLSLKDKLTGLYNASYIRERLSEEIQRAIHYQRPCSFVYLSIENFEIFSVKNGASNTDEMLKSIAKILNIHMSEFDRAARVNKYEFALIFPDKNKKKTIEIVERIRNDFATLFSKTDKEDSLSCSIGISENPIDGVTSDELFVKAQGRIKFAKKNGVNTLEAFA